MPQFLRLQPTAPGLQALAKARILIKRNDLLFVLGFFTASRVWLEVIGLLAASYIRPELKLPYVWTYSRHTWLDLWGVLDTGWYLSVASQGYMPAPVKTGLMAGQANWAFFPAYPVISTWFAGILNVSTFAAMVILSNLCFLCALMLIRREAEDEFGAPAARATIAVLCLMPASYVFSSAYAESLLLLAIAATFALIRRKCWLAAGLVATLATLTRNTGIGLELPLVISGWPIVTEAWSRKAPSSDAAASRRQALRLVAASSLPLIGLAGFCAFLYVRTGHPLAFVSVQGAWNRRTQFPLVPLLRPFINIGYLAPDDILNFVFAWIAVVMLVPLVHWRRWPLLAFAAFLVFAPLSEGLLSYVRFTTTMLPNIMAAGALLATRRRATQIVLIILATINGFMMVGWALGLRFVM